MTLTIFLWDSKLPNCCAWIKMQFENPQLTLNHRTTNIHNMLKWWQTKKYTLNIFNHITTSNTKFCLDSQHSMSNQIVLRPLTMVLNGYVESNLQHVGVLQWCVEWWCGWKERLNQFNMLNLTPEGHAASFRWPEMARAPHEQTTSRETAGGGGRIWFVDNWGHVFGSDWLSGFLSFQ